MSVYEYKDKKTIIVGEVKTGKTAYLSELINEFICQGEDGLVLIDMAPEQTKGVGGKMNITEAGDLIRYRTAPIVAPRLMGRTTDEVDTLAKQNAELIENIFFEYLKNPGRTLFVNDISLYLQAGALCKLLSWLSSTPTVIMNGYYGSSLGGGKLGRRERKNMWSLMERCDRIIQF
ncbi:MAG: hypothetical protein JSV55_11340 [Deltaproteobacteria bacterium]|nr:MAG: hypothetical protein JSV55_11340 [Deltaproteobacteria bacterium]